MAFSNGLEINLYANILTQKYRDICLPFKLNFQLPARMCIRCLCAGRNLGGNVSLHMLPMAKEVQEKNDGGLEKKTTCGFKDNMWL